MLCTFITDAIRGEVQCGECLCETKRMRDSTETVGMLHGFVVELWQGAVLLHHRSD
jgi:hypothetical protein